MAYRECFLCGANGTCDPLDKHHIFGGANRKLSDKYGLTVYLCHFKCHENGKKAVHRCRETADKLHRYGQKKFMREQGATVEEFRLIFGKNYLDDDEIEALEQGAALEYNEDDFRTLDESLEWVC